jgi:hypothetical protein
MPTEALVPESNRPPATALLPWSWRRDLRSVRVVRLALVATTALFIAQMFNWPLSFVAPVLVVAFMEMPIPKPSLREFAAFLSYAILSVVGGYVFVMLFEPYPLIFIPAYSLAVFLCAYFLHKGASIVLILLVFLGLLILPIVGNVDEGLTAFLGACLLLSEVVAIVTIQLAHGILPDPPGTEGDGMPGFQSGYSAHAARSAAATAIIIVPALTAILVFNWSSQLVLMIYIGIIALEGSRAHSVYDTKKYLIANAIAGVCAFIAYLILQVVPEVHVFVLLTLLATLLFAHRRFSDAPGAKFFGSALIGLIILVSSSLGAGADLDANIVKRIFAIFLAGMYVIGLMSITEPLLDPAHDSETTGH